MNKIMYDSVCTACEHNKKTKTSPQSGVTYLRCGRKYSYPKNYREGWLAFKAEKQPWTYPLGCTEPGAMKTIALVFNRRAVKAS